VADVVPGLFNARLSNSCGQEYRNERTQNHYYMIYKLNFYTSYHQFYISDKESPKKTDADDFWTEESTYSRLAIGDGILGVGLECYGSFKGELILLDSGKDNIEYSQYDHIVEGGINVKSGILQVLDCPNSNVELEVKVNPGKYRVRIYSLNIASVIDDDGEDYYKIEMWSDTNMGRAVLKQYSRIGEKTSDD
jgi:hypothetical protein